MKVVNILNQSNPENCKPDIKTISYLKKNLLYCFDPQHRQLLKDSIHKIEETFFSKT